MSHTWLLDEQYQHRFYVMDTECLSSERCSRVVILTSKYMLKYFFTSKSYMNITRPKLIRLTQEVTHEEANMQVI